DVVIHCAGIAHQKIGSTDLSTYMHVNSEATENLAKTAAENNPDMCFIFLSSISVYGEGRQGGRNRQIEQSQKNHNSVGEDSECLPSSDYAFSKLDAERRLFALNDQGKIQNLKILRLAPVYDREWSFNLDRRVTAPFNIAYIKYGSGRQEMSALARPNLVDFIEYLISGLKRNQRIDIFNVCDEKTYNFNQIIRTLKDSGDRHDRPVISIPLPVVWWTTRVAGILFPQKRRWLYGCYDKLSSNLIFDNEKMLNTGFQPVYSLQTIFSPTEKKKR
ncbi:MAG TPA: NAD-dependent epimerase/dehydratase family protein, partial [Balneolales bacterium]|nr:NAD-dependent epimerase/dehydratase family protein [Balneolales bacterium]